MRTPVAPHDDSRPRLAHDFTRGAPTCRFRFYAVEGDFWTQKNQTGSGRLGVCLVFRVLDRTVSHVLNTGLPRQCSGREQHGWLNGSIKSAIARTSLSSMWIFAGIAKDFGHDRCHRLLAKS